MISKSDTLSRVLAKNASSRKPSPSVPTIAIFWIKFTRFYPKPFPALGELDEYSQNDTGQRLQAVSANFRFPMLWSTGQLPRLVSCIAPLPPLVFFALLFGKAIYIGLPKETHNNLQLWIHSRCASFVYLVIAYR
jgi:hypothetical protein